MAGTFTWRPSFPVSDDRKPKTHRSNFGDGYVQRAAKGINSNPAMVPLTFSGRDDVEADAIMDFLDLKAGHESFTWVNLRGQSGLYICEQYGRTWEDEEKNVIRATFERVFGG